MRGSPQENQKIRKEILWLAIWKQERRRKVARLKQRSKQQPNGLTRPGDGPVRHPPGTLAPLWFEPVAVAAALWAPARFRREFTQREVSGGIVRVGDLAALLDERRLIPIHEGPIVAS